MITYQKIYSQFESVFFASCTIGILVSSCIGGITAMAVLQNGTNPLQIFELALVVAFAMAFNGSVLSQQKPKIVFNLLILSLVMNTILTAINFIKFYA